MSDSNEPTARPPGRGRLRYSLRAVMLVTSLVAIGLGGLSVSATRQARAVRQIEAAGGRVYYHWQELHDAWGGTYADGVAPGPPALRRVLGRHYFDKAVAVEIDRGTPEVLEEIARPLKSLGGLQRFAIAFDAQDRSAIMRASSFADRVPTPLPDLAEVLRGSRELEHLRIGYPIALAPSFCERVGQSRTLERLDLWNVTLDRSGFAAIISAPALKRLSLLNVGFTGDDAQTPTRFDDAAADCLSTARGLESLRIDVEDLSTEGFEAVGNLTTLKNLTLNGEWHTAHALDRLSALGELRSLQVSHGVLSPGSLTALASLPKLEVLTMAADRWGENDPTELGDLDQLRVLALRRKSADLAAIEAVKRLRGLASLRLQNDQPWWSPEAEAALRAALPTCQVRVDKISRRRSSN